MAHWVGILNQEDRLVFTGKSKEEVIFNIGSAMTNRNRYMASTIQRQLREVHDAVAVAYGAEAEEVAKVFKCSCGSVKRHTEEH